MSERGFELSPKPEVWARVVEANAEKISYSLRNNIRWYKNARGNALTARARFYLTDTGHVCKKDDIQVEAVCVADFVHQRGVTSCAYMDCVSIAGGKPVHPELQHIAQLSVDMAADEASDFQRLLNVH